MIHTRILVRFTRIGDRAPIDLSFTTPATGTDVQRAVADAVFEHIHTRRYVDTAPQIEAGDTRTGVIRSGTNPVGTFRWTETPR